MCVFPVRPPCVASLFNMRCRPAPAPLPTPFRPLCHALQTNGGGVTERFKAHQLSEYLGVHVHESQVRWGHTVPMSWKWILAADQQARDGGSWKRPLCTCPGTSPKRRLPGTLQVVLSHTPFRQLAQKYADLPVLISGRGQVGRMGLCRRSIMPLVPLLPPQCWAARSCQPAGPSQQRQQKQDTVVAAAWWWPGSNWPGLGSSLPPACAAPRRHAACLQVRDVARRYGFKHVVTTHQLTRAMPAAVPFHEDQARAVRAVAALHAMCCIHACT